MTTTESTLSQQVAKVEPPVVSDEILRWRNLRLNFGGWVPGLCRWRPVGQALLTSFNGQQPVAFSVDDIDLPTAAQRWKVNLSGHPETSFDDLRDGKWPELSREDLETRQQALHLAKAVHDKIDIRPLRTSTIIREIRD